MAVTSLVLLAAAQVATAHFGLTYPPWRADTLKDTNVTKFSQWVYPCAGVNVSAGSRTDWPLDGGSVKLDLHHDWTYVFINLAVGAEATNFNVSLTPDLVNSTGEGTLCIPKVPIPANANVTDGAMGSIQVVTLGERGQALYNCADIKFSSSAKQLSSDECKSEGVTSSVVHASSGNGTACPSGGSSGGNNTGGGGGNGGGGNTPGGAAALRFPTTVLTCGVGLAFVFVAGVAYI